MTTEPSHFRSERFTSDGEFLPTIVVAILLQLLTLGLAASGIRLSSRSAPADGITALPMLLATTFLLGPTLMIGCRRIGDVAVVTICFLPFVLVAAWMSSTPIWLGFKAAAWALSMLLLTGAMILQFRSRSSRFVAVAAVVGLAAMGPILRYLAADSGGLARVGWLAGWTTGPLSEIAKMEQSGIFVLTGSGLPIVAILLARVIHNFRVKRA